MELSQTWQVSEKQMPSGLTCFDPVQGRRSHEQSKGAGLLGEPSDPREEGEGGKRVVTPQTPLRSRQIQRGHGLVSQD